VVGGFDRLLDPLEVAFTLFALGDILNKPTRNP